MLTRTTTHRAVLMGFVLVLFTAKAAEDPSAILSAVQRSYAGARTLTADVVLRRRTTAAPETVTLRGTAALEKPGKARLQLDGPGGRTVVSDGTNLWTVIPEAKRCLRARVVHPRTFALLGAKPLSLFFADHGFTFGLPVRPESTRLLAPEAVAGIRCEVVEVMSDVLGKQRIRYFIGPDRLVRRMAAELEYDGQRVEEEVELRHVVANGAIDPTRFQFAPRSSFRLQAADNPTPLLGVGDRAPDFNLMDTHGHLVSLAATLKRCRAVWLNFWFRRCEPCVAEFAHLVRLYDECKRSGVELIAVNASDGIQVIRRFKQERSVPFPMVAAGLRGVAWNLLEVSEYGVLEEYDVRSFPTNLIVDRRGRILARIEGFDEPAIRKALAQVGIHASEGKARRQQVPSPAGPSGESSAEPSAAPNGGPAASLGNS